jgi:hypothetical protein
MKQKRLNPKQKRDSRNVEEQQGHLTRTVHQKTDPNNLTHFLQMKNGKTPQAKKNISLFLHLHKSGGSTICEMANRQR